MNRALLGVVALVTSSLVASTAAAEDTWQSVFETDGPVRAGRFEVGLVEKHCSFQMMSRMGPDPKEVAACDASVARLSARGASAVPAILASLDSEGTSHSARERLYAALAKSGDPAVAAKMIDAMAKVAQNRVERRAYEAVQMEEVAKTILRAAPSERAPWVRDVADPYVAITDQVIAWRVHQRDNAGKSLDDVAAERLAKARAEKADPDAQKAFLAVRHLIEVDPVEGRAAAEALELRYPKEEGVEDSVRQHVRSLAGWALHRLRQEVAEGRVGGEALPAAPPRPNLKKKKVAAPAAPMPLPALPSADAKARS
jgi:hypothetical protein